MTRRLALGAVLAAAGLALTGCAGLEQGQEAQSTYAGPTPSCAATATWTPQHKLAVAVSTPGPAHLVVTASALDATPVIATGDVPANGSGATVQLAVSTLPADVVVTITSDGALSSCTATLPKR